MSVEVENLAPFKCRDHGHVTGPLLSVVADMVRLCAGQQEEVLAGVEVLERMVERVLDTPSSSEAAVGLYADEGRHGLVVDDVHVRIRSSTITLRC